MRVLGSLSCDILRQLQMYSAFTINDKIIELWVLCGEEEEKVPGLSSSARRNASRMREGTKWILATCTLILVIGVIMLTFFYAKKKKNNNNRSDIQ